MPGPRKYMAANDAAAAASGGGKHWTKAERQARLESEVKPPPPKSSDPSWIKNPPDYLTEQQKKDFRRFARQLLALDVGFCQMDVEFLAWYIVARDEYEVASIHVQDALMDGASKPAATWIKTRNTLFAQARACANELGLTISSRCKLVIPQREDDEADRNPIIQLMERFEKNA